MAYHIKARFADLCGIEKNKLAVYIKRGKVICSGDLIDDSLAINQEFIEKWQVKTGLREQEITVKEPIEQLQIKPKAPNVQPPIYPKQKIPNVQEPEFHFSGNQLDKQIKEVDLERKMEELEIAKLKRQKMAGESMPTDLVKNTISVYSRSVSRAFNNAADNLLVEFTVAAELSREQVSEMRRKLNLIVNDAVKNACDNAMDMVDNIVDEYKEVRGRGEKIG
jgi:hypothetical protein